MRTTRDDDDDEDADEDGPSMEKDHRKDATSMTKDADEDGIDGEDPQDPLWHAGPQIDTQSDAHVPLSSSSSSSS